MQSRFVWTLAAVAALALGAAGLAAAKADSFMIFGAARSSEPAVYHSSNTPSQDRLLAKAAFAEVLARKGETLGMAPPLNLAPYAPVFPDGLILTEAESTTSPTGGSLEYAAAGSLRTLLDFYEDAAALNHLPFHVTAEGPDTLVFTAAEGHRRVQARLTRQFAQGTQVQLSYS
jgi:hypothetical protein